MTPNQALFLALHESAALTGRYMYEVENLGHTWDSRGLDIQAEQERELVTLMSRTKPQQKHATLVNI